MRALLVNILSIAALLAPTRAPLANDAVAVEWLSDQAVAYIASGARLIPPDDPSSSWTLESGAIRVACRAPIRVAASGHNLTMENGIGRLSLDGDRLLACSDEGVLVIDGHELSAGECAAVSTGGGFEAVSESELRVAEPLQPSLEAGPIAHGDPWLDLDSTMVAAGIGANSSGQSNDGIEAGGSAACLDSSSSGSEMSTPDAPDLVQPEVDRDWHVLSVDVTLEGL